MKKFSYTTFVILLLIIMHDVALSQSTYGVSFGSVIGNNGTLLNSENDTDTVKSFRNGYQVGLKANFGTYSFYISPSIHYKSVTVKNSFEKINAFQKSPSLKIGKAKVVIGYQTNLFTKKIKFKIGGGLNGNYILNIADNDEGFTFNDVKDVYLAYNIDIGFDILIVNINISYEKSLKDTYVSTPNHKFDFLVFSAGVMF